MSETEDPLDRLGEIYLCANVPSYLIREFRHDPFVKELVEFHSLDVLLNAAQVANEKSSVRDRALAYACVVAAGLKVQQAANLATGTKLPGLCWGNRILEAMVEFSSEDADDGAPARDDLHG